MKSGTMDLLKFKRLQRRLGESTRGVVGLLEMLWAGACKNCPRGDIGKFDNEDIAVMCDWDGDPDELVATLVECGWIDEDEEYRLVIHDWHDHAPNFVKGNAKHLGGLISGKQKADPKDHPRDHPKDTPRDTPKDHPQGGSPSPIPPSQVKSSQVKPSQVKSDSCSEPPPEASEPEEELTDFAFDALGGKRWILPASLYATYKPAYPAIELDVELRKAAAWLVSNPNQRKTPKGMSRFINGWLSKAQNSARPSPSKKRTDKNGEELIF
jgi:hypothetical protein